MFFLAQISNFKYNTYNIITDLGVDGAHGEALDVVERHAAQVHPVDGHHLRFTMIKLI